METKEKTIQSLRLFFESSTTVYELQRNLLNIVGKTVEVSAMEILHIEAKKELEKDNPNGNTLDLLLAKMESLAK